MRFVVVVTQQVDHPQLKAESESISPDCIRSLLIQTHRRSLQEEKLFGLISTKLQKNIILQLLEDGEYNWCGRPDPWRWLWIFGWTIMVLSLTTFWKSISTC
jgi:hypothetical protein